MSGLGTGSSARAARLWVCAPPTCVWGTTSRWDSRPVAWDLARTLALAVCHVVTQQRVFASRPPGKPQTHTAQEGGWSAPPGDIQLSCCSRSPPRRSSREDHVAQGSRATLPSAEPAPPAETCPDLAAFRKLWKHHTFTLSAICPHLSGNSKLTQKTHR